jgi:alkanesulfonate monooxygenase SsuD/methylene tetrahydromethanopterin reductase-like flavin-dependent oxidoreductase (luciferase family)
MPGGVARENRSQHLSLVEHGLEMVKGKFDSAWFADHLQFESRDVLESWTALTYLAARHADFQFGNAVLCQSFRNPALVAKMGATLHFLSGGRFILGLGAGWKEDEYVAYGYDFPPTGVRIEQLDEYVKIIKALWTQEQATLRGQYYRVENAYCEPKPEPMPTIMIGAMKPRMISLAVQHADWWNVSWTTLEDYKGMVEVCERECEQTGRNPRALRRTWFGGCICAPNEAEFEKLLGGRTPPHGGISGTAEQVIEQMQGFVDLGVNYFMLGTPGLPNFTTLETLLDEVLPALNV